MSGKTIYRGFASIFLMILWKHEFYKLRKEQDIREETHRTQKNLQNNREQMQYLIIITYFVSFKKFHAILAYE
jgi:hypothetical protein